MKATMSYREMSERNLTYKPEGAYTPGISDRYNEITKLKADVVNACLVDMSLTDLSKLFYSKLKDSPSFPEEYKQDLEQMTCISFDLNKLEQIGENLENIRVEKDDTIRLKFYGLSMDDSHYYVDTDGLLYSRICDPLEGEKVNFFEPDANLAKAYSSDINEWIESMSLYYSDLRESIMSKTLAICRALDEVPEKGRFNTKTISEQMPGINILLGDSVGKPYITKEDMALILLNTERQYFSLPSVAYLNQIMKEDFSIGKLYDCMHLPVNPKVETKEEFLKDMLTYFGDENGKIKISLPNQAYFDASANYKKEKVLEEVDLEEENERE